MQRRGSVLVKRSGIGSFFGLMPDVIRAKSSLTGIELDRVVGGMAQMLYPDANIRIMGYEKSATADGFYDLVIGNWPFAKEGPSDPRYNSLGLSLHDYFFVKALDQTRPGGLVIGITSSGTMDKKGQTARRQMARRAELVAAFRFPTGAFEKYAGTKVVTDVVILKKRENPASAVEEDGWMNTEQNGKGNETFNANEYWRKHPENVLGEMKYGHGTTQGRAGMIVERQDDYQDKLARIEQSLPKDILTKSDKPEKVTFQNREDTADQNSVTWSEKDGAMPAGFYIVRGEQLQPLEDLFTWTLKEEKKTEKRRDELKQLLGLREDIKELLRGQREGDPQTETIRARSKVKYDAFIKTHGAIGNSFMLKALDKAGDPMALTLKNLERAEGGKFVPRDILLKDIMRRPVADAKGDIGDAYAIQRNQSTTLDVDAVAKLAGKPVDEVIARLVDLDQIYKTPTGEWDAAEEYLGGNVRRKLREARDAKEQGIDMDRNIEALEKVQPKDVAYFEIEVQMGASWIPREDYLNFASHLLSSEAETAGKDFELTRAISGWNFKINNESLKRGTGATATWGTQSISFAKIFQAAMNGTTVKIYDTDRDGVKTLNAAETDLANKKIDDIREELANWLWSDPSRAGRIANDYNEVMNSEVVPKRNGSHLRFEGLALTMGTAEFDFRQHQKDAVWRGIMDGQMLAAHEVGTGKTFTMAGLAVEGRRLGKFRKSLVFAHNANAESVYKDFQAAYPGGKFLFIGSLSPTNRENAMRQIANDEWDAIVVTHSLIDRFALREETLMEIAQKQIKQLESEIADALQDLGVNSLLNIDDEAEVGKALKFVKDSHTAKELVKTRNRIIKRIKDKAAKAMSDNSVFFEDLGVDAIMVDEAHMFKKIALATRKEVKGLNKTESDRGWMLGALTDTVKARNNGKGVFLFTGTPLTNNLNEAYNMMRFVMDGAMEDAGLNGFDDWFNSFAQAVSDVELTTGGTYEPVTRLLSFINVPELARLAGRYFDVVQAKSMPEFIPRASTEGKTPGGLGRPFKVMRPVTTEMTPEQKEHKRSIQARYRAFQALSGKDKRKAMLNGVDTPIQLESEGIKAALDMRLIDPTLPDSPDSKANLMVRNAISHYQEDPKATQMIFMERGWNDFTDAQVSMKDENGVTVKDFDGKKITSKQRRPQFNLVRDMVEKLIAQGVRPDEIAVFSDMTLDPVKDRPGDVLRKVNRVSGSVSKEDLAALMREGKIRFAFGSTQTMGTGVNAQANMRAMHHLDAPWTPGEFEQRNGRGHRQGNQWNTVYEYRYFTEGSHDGRRWQVLLNKVKFISRFTEMLVDAGGSSLRVLTGDGADLNEGGSDVADFESSFSTAAGDPRILVRAKLKGDVEKLERRRDTHYQSIERAKGDIKRLKQSKTYSNGRIKSITSALERWNKAKEGPFSIKIGEKTYTDRKEVEAYLAAFPSLTQKDNGKLIVEYNGAKIFHRWQTWEGGKSTFQMELPTDNDVIVLNPSLSLGSIEATVRGQTRVLNNIQEDFDSIDGSVASLEEMIQKPFTREAELETKQAALQQIQVELDRAPQPAPSWLRNGAPVGSLVYLEDGKAYDVAAHRWDENGWWVLVENESGMQPVDYRKVMDETGHPMFEEVEFTAPDRNDSEEDEDSNVIPGITITTSMLQGYMDAADESIREKGILGATSKTARNVNNAAMDGWLFNQASYRKTDGRLTTLRRLEAKLEQKSEDDNRPNEPLLEKVRSEIKGIELQKMSDAKMQVSTALRTASIPAADSSGQSPSENVDPSSNAPDRIAPGDKGESGLSPEGEIRRSRELAIAVFRGEAAASRSHLSEGSESVVERVGQDWTIKTIVPKGVMSYTRDGKLTRSTSFADVELKARFINLLGGFETHAVEDAGQSYLIQRYGKGFVSESELENLSLPFNLKAGHVNRVQLDDKEFIISDLHHKNFRRDENGKIRIIDLIVSEVIPNVSLLDDGNSSLLTATIPAAQNLESLKQRGRVAFAKARPLIEEAEGTIKDFGAGSLGVNPKFANFGGANQDSRNQVDIVRAYDTFAHEVRKDRDTFAKAKELLAKDPAGVEELALGVFGEGKPAIADHDQLAIEMFIQQRLAGSGDSRQAQVDNFVLIQANILNRRETARTLRIGFDKFMTPEERAHQQLADAIFRVHPKVEARAKTMTLAERKTFLAEAGSARIAEVEKELKKLGLRISQVIGKNRALQLENSRMMREVLKTRDLMDQKIIQAVQKGATLADIKRTLGKDAAAKAQEVATKARAELFEKIKAMAASGMSRDQIREALKDSLKSSPLGAASNGMTDADIWSMIEQDFGIAETIPERALPTAKPKKVKQEKLEATNPLSSNWARPEFTDGMNAYQFDTKDRAGIMERVEIIRGLAGAVGKIDSLQGDKRTQAEAKLKEINAILAKYGTDAAGIFDASQGIESYGFDVTDIAQVAAVARAINAIDADVVDKASEYLYASMLSGLQTMLVNATAIVPAVWESTVGRGVNMAINRFVKDPMAEQSGEAKYILKALAPAITRAKSNFQASMAAQHPMFDRDVNAMEVDWDKILGGGSHKMIGSISGRKGDLIRIPMRLLTATDDFNRTLLACCEVGTFAYRIAKAKGMKPGSPEMDKFIRVEVNTPGSFSYQLASKKASSAIYSNPLPGQKDPHTGKPVPVRDLGDVVGFVASKITDAVSKEHDSIFLKAVSAAFRISFFPFQRTPFNIIRKGIRHTLNPFSLFDIGLGIVQNNRGANPDGTTKWEWNAQGRNPELIERAGQQLQGAILMTLLVGAAAGEGDDDDMDKPFVITGSLPFLPSNMAERDARMRSGIGAYRVSFRRKDGSERFGFSYGRMEPVATLLSSTIDTIKSVKRSDRAGGTSYDAAASAMGGFASQAQDKTFMRGVGDLIGLVKNIVAEPDIKENRKALQFLAGRVAMVVPNIIKQPIREMDPQFRDRSTGFMEEMLYQAAPYGQKPAKVDPYGQVLHKPGTAASRPLDVADTGTDTVNPIDRMLVKWSDSGKWSKAENPSDRKPWFPAPIMNAEFKHSKTGQNVKMNGGQLAEFREKAGKRAMVLLKAANLNTQNPTARDVEKVKEIISKSRSDIKKMLAFKFSR